MGFVIRLTQRLYWQLLGNFCLFLQAGVATCIRFQMYVVFQKLFVCGVTQQTECDFCRVSLPPQPHKTQNAAKRWL